MKGAIIYIINSKGNYVIKPQEEKRDFKKYTKVAENINEGYKEVKNNGEECIVACQDMGIQDWKLVGVFSMDDITSLAPYYSTIIAIIMGMNIIFVFLCSTLLTYLIFKPLRKIENHMQIVENGEFITMPVDDYDNEITNLRKVFNHMILSVKALMKRVKDEERIIAKGKSASADFPPFSRSVYMIRILLFHLLPLLLRFLRGRSTP